MAEGHFRGHTCEARTLGESRAGHAQVFIDDDHLFFGPTQLAGFLDQSILASCGFAVVLDLRGTRLANVDESGALDMSRFYFARVIHDSFPSPQCLERLGRSVGPGSGWRGFCVPRGGFPRGRFRRGEDRTGFDFFLALALSLVLVESPSSLVTGARRPRRASTRARACSKSSREASVVAAGVPMDGGVGEAKSVQSAGIKDLLPSGKIRTRRSRPFRCIAPKTLSDRPSNGWRTRTTVTFSGRY